MLREVSCLHKRQAGYLAEFFNNTSKEIAFPVVNETIYDGVGMLSAISSVNFLCVCAGEGREDTPIEKENCVICFFSGISFLHQVFGRKNMKNKEIIRYYIS